MSKMSLTDLSAPKALYPNTAIAENGQPHAVIVRPTDVSYVALAEQVQAEIQKRSGAVLPIVTDREVAEVPEQNAILLGNVNTNHLVFRLYGFNYTPADDLYPGQGGYLVQTIHDPWGNGHNAVGLFGSNLDGVKASVNRFIGQLTDGQTISIGRTFDVKFGRDALKIPKLLDEPNIDDEMASAEEALKRGEHTGLWGRIGDRGLLYGLTGKEVYAELYKRLVYRMYDHVLSKPDNYGGVWGFDADFALNRVMPGWDLVEESPMITDEDRLKITRILFEFVSACVSHVGNMDVPHVRHNHTTFAALGLFYSGKYFQKYYGASEAEEWLSLSKKCFEFQARAFKPHEDCSGYQWHTHYHLTKYTLSSGDMTYFEMGNAAKAADYSILTTDNLSYALPYGDNASPFGWWNELPFLRAVVCVTGDGRYQWMLNKKTAVEPRYAAYEYHRTVVPKRPDDLDGVQTFPVDALYYASNKGEDHLPIKKTFDKVVFRDGFDPEGQYLFLDGLSNGGHKHYDGNSISRITENGRIWLADCDYIKSLPKFHNGVLIFKDGQSAAIPPFAELERIANFAHSGFSETTLRSYSGIDWHRNILWNRGRYFLVADEMTAQEESDYTFRAIWQTLGDVTVREGGLSVGQNGEQFFIKGLPGPRLKLTRDAETGKNWAAYQHADPVVHILQQIADVHLKAGETYTYFNLLYCSDDKQPQNLKMAQVSNGAVRIDGGAEVVFAGVGATGLKIPSGPTVSAEQFHISPSGFALVDGTELTWGSVAFKSDIPVSIEYDLSSGEGTVMASRKTRISLPADGRKSILVNGKRATSRVSKGSMTLTVTKGKHHIRLVSDTVMKLARLSEQKSKPQVSVPSGKRAAKRRVQTLKTVWTYQDGGAFLSVRSADVDGDGKAEIIAGGRGTTVCAVKDGKTLWQFKTGGEVRSVWAADIEGDGKPEVMVGSADTKVYTLDAQGKERWQFEIPLYYRKPMLKTVFAADIDGDGKLEVIAGAESWRYYAFTHDGKELWHHMTVHSSTQGCAADIDGDGKAEVLAGTEYYSWHCIDGKGESRWAYRTTTGPRTNSVAAGDVNGDGLKEVAWAGADTNIHLVNVEGKLQWLYNTGDEVTQVAMADVDGDGLDEIVASSMSFNVYVIKGDGKTRLWRTDLNEVVRCFVVADFNGDGKLEVAAGTEDGVISVLANENGQVIGRFQTGGAVLTIDAADVDGDGIAEIIAASEDGLLYALTVQ